MKIKLIASDPGTKNYAISVVTLEKLGKKFSVTVHENGMIKETVKGIKDSHLLKKELLQYVKKMKKLEKSHKPNALAAERFMTRGIKGPTVEYLNMMLGALNTNTKLPIKLIPAVTWKVAIAREGIDLKAEYKKTKALPHQVDATMIGIYVALHGFKVKGFKDSGIKKLFPGIIKQIEKTSTSKLINRKT